MRRAAFYALALALMPSQAGAFLFGRTSDDRAAGILARMTAAFEGGDCPAAVELSSELFREKPPSAFREKAYSYLGRCYESQGAPDKAVAVYKLADGLYPDNSFFASRLAAIYMKSGFYESAVPLYERELGRRSDDIVANAGLARCYASLGFLSKAKTYYSRAAVLGDFRDLELLREYAAVMLRKRDWDEAELILGYAAGLAPGDAALLEASARAASGRGDYAKAAARLREAAALAPSDRSLRLELALAELLGGDPRPALSAVPSTAGENSALALVLRGLALSKTGDKTGAEECFRKASAFRDRPFIAAFSAALAGEGAGQADMRAIE